MKRNFKKIKNLLPGIIVISMFYGITEILSQRYNIISILKENNIIPISTDYKKFNSKNYLVNEYNNRIVFYLNNINITKQLIDYNKDGCFESEVISGFARVGGGFSSKKNLENKLCYN